MTDRELDMREYLEARIAALEEGLRFCLYADLARRAGDLSYDDDRIESIARSLLTELSEAEK